MQSGRLIDAKIDFKLLNVYVNITVANPNSDPKTLRTRSPIPCHKSSYDSLPLWQTLRSTAQAPLLASLCGHQIEKPP